MKRDRWKAFLVAFFVLATALPGLAQTTTIKGKVYSSYDRTPLAGAVVSVLDTTVNVQTGRDGSFTLEDLGPNASKIRVWSPGYYESIIDILGRDDFEIVLIGEGRYNYQNVVDGSFSDANAPVVPAENFRKGASAIEEVLTGSVAGLQVFNKSGMVTEGGLLKFRGIRSFEAENAPLIVIDGVPYLPDAENSPIIGAYSRSVFGPVNLHDIQRIRLLKGAETARFGSMGSNGVLWLETSSSNDMETVVEFRGSYGIAQNYQTIPMLDASGYKSLLGAVGLTEFEDMGELMVKFPFLRDDPNYYYKYIYNNNTDWQDVIYRTGFVTDNHLRIKGGDAIAKYDLSLGVVSQQAALDQTSNTRYNTRLNSNILLGKKFDLQAIMGLTYNTGKLREQGMLPGTNPLLAALHRSPVLSTHQKDVDNNLLPDLDGVRQFDVSNPVALLESGDFKSDIYDVFVQANLGYKANDNLQFNGQLGLFTNYVRQTAFIPGLSSGTIVPLNDGIALNTVRSGAGQTNNISWNVYGTYHKNWTNDQAVFGGGVQGLLNSQEYDAGSGRNTSSDFYRTLNYVANDGRMFWGYNEQWNWMNVYGYTEYNWRSLAKLNVSLSLDGSSVSGADAKRFGFFPAADLSLLLSNMSFLNEVSSVDNLVLKMGYAKTGNSRFSSKLSKAYYSSQLYRELAGIVVGNIPNEGIRWEDNENWQANLIFSGLDQRFNINVGYYYNKASNLLNAVPVSPIAGIDRVFVNGGQIDNHGLEIDVNAAIVDNENWSVTLGGNISTANSTIKKLAGGDVVMEQEDGVVRVNRVGESPNSFYGYRFMGVVESEAQSQTLGLQDFRGRIFGAGDAIFADLHEDGIINEDDQMLLGGSLPDLFGGAFIGLRYKNVQLQGLFSFSKGGNLYNGVRRSLESLNSYANQSDAALRRWQADGQVTDIPKASFGDPMENNRFSSRWIEDASFLRLESITLTYRFGNNARLKVLANSEWYIAGENLFTWSDYLGLDPVTAYSNAVGYLGADYGKIPLPRTFKLGVNIKL